MQNIFKYNSREIYILWQNKPFYTIFIITNKSNIKSFKLK